MTEKHFKNRKLIANRNVTKMVRKMERWLLHKGVILESRKKIYIAKVFCEHFEIEPPKKFSKKEIDKWVIYLKKDLKINISIPEESQVEKDFKKKRFNRGYIGGGKVQRKVVANTGGSKVYLILCWKGNEKFLKVGMTTQPLENRLSRLPYHWREIAHTKVEGEWLYEFEQAIHGLMKEHRYHPSIKFQGHTECYKVEAKNKILAML